MADEQGDQPTQSTRPNPTIYDYDLPHDREGWAQWWRDYWDRASRANATKQRNAQRAATVFDRLEQTRKDQS